MAELELLPGEFVQCRSDCNKDEGLCITVKIWPRNTVHISSVECGPRLLAQLGLCLGQRLLIRALEEPLLGCDHCVLDGDVGLSGQDLSHLAWQWKGSPVWEGCVMLTSHGGRVVPVRVISCLPPRALITQNTRIIDGSVSRSGMDPAVRSNTTATTASKPLVGMEKVVARLVRCMDWSLGSQDASSTAALVPRGLLLTGPVGSGKSAVLLCALAQRPLYNVVHVSDPESASAVQAALGEACSRTPCVVVVDHLERVNTITPLVAALTALPRPASGGCSVFVIGLTSDRLDSLNTSLRTHFEITIEIGALEPLQRVAILRELLDDGDATIVPADLQLPGMVAGDVAAVAREAKLLAQLRHSQVVTVTDVRQAVRRVHQHSSREWDIDVPHVSLDAIGGMRDVKARLIELLDWPLRYGEALKRLGVRPSSGVLMYGPPGNGKTMMARAVASRSQATFIAVKGPELYSKYVGESERALEQVFVQARRSVPCVVFLDEIDALAPRRDHTSGGHVGDRVLSTLLSQLDGVTPLSGVTVLAATNRPDQLDPALLRPGRLSHHL